MSKGIIRSFTVLAIFQAVSALVLICMGYWLAIILAAGAANTWFLRGINKRIYEAGK